MQTVVPKRRLAFCVLWSILFITSCGSKEKREHEFPTEVPVYTEQEAQELFEISPKALFSESDGEYDVHIWSKEQTGIGRPYGICALEDKVYVCDFDNNCVVELDVEGNRTASYGELGAEPGNFTNPTAIIRHNDLIYVLDQGNHRVQIFDKEMRFQEEVPYTGVYFERTVFMHDMAVDGNGTIYMSVWTNYVKDAAVYYIAENGKATPLEPHISGVLAEWEGEVYAANTFTLCYIGESRSQVNLLGNNFLLKCAGDGFDQIAEFPYAYTPADFCISNSRIYAISLSGEQLNLLTMDGQAESAVCLFDRDERDMTNFENEPANYPFYLDVVDDDHIYAVDSLWKTVYYFEKK